MSASFDTKYYVTKTSASLVGCLVAAGGDASIVSALTATDHQVAGAGGSASF